MKLPDDVTLEATTFLERVRLIPSQTRRLAATPFAKANIPWWRCLWLVIWGVFHGLPMKMNIPKRDA